MRKSEPIQAHPATVATPLLQRRCATCGGSSSENMGGQCETCGTEAEAQDGSAPAIVHRALSSSGDSLDPAVRGTMEQRFGRDFSEVRVHTDSLAAESAQAVSATAYTVGRDIVFAGGAYAPAAQSGQRLLAHELTHVMQQGGRAYRSGEKIELGNPASAEEAEADQAEVGGADGSTLDTSMQLQRQPAAPPPPPPVPATPTVALGNFKNSGNTDAENNCPLCPLTLGPSATDGTNGMEIRGDITGHVAGASYDIKRTKERGTWKKVGAAWTQLSHVGPGADDDSHNSDEDLTPQNDHIFVIDTPGFTSAGNPTGDAAATEAVYKASFIETCNVKVGAGAWAQSSNSVAWHSITWLEKVGGAWQRKAGSNEIATGATVVGTGDP